jgi:hypothetical protein
LALGASSLAASYWSAKFVARPPGKNELDFSTAVTRPTAGARVSVPLTHFLQGTARFEKQK